ncbi:uncharacterized protein [Clytia hemisphaerica]|uniref:Tesmin/TSO1-like CXC domain-containing protein n=1 Tax=Clytia hemisphaerica TaxID=252671 RepID=A0A7M5XNI4_9CNID
MNYKRQRLEPVTNYKSYIEILIQENKLSSSAEFDSQNLENLNLYPQFIMMPNVLFWDLETKLKDIQLLLPSCPECGGGLKTLPVDKGANYFMRQLYCVSEIKLLVSTKLCCSYTKKHQFAGYDPRILEKTNNSGIEIPFKLFHRAGVTLQLSTFIFENICNGSHIKKLHELILKNYGENLNKKSVNFGLKFSRETIEMEHMIAFLSSQRLCLPSPPLLTQCFLSYYNELECGIKKTCENIDVPDGFVYIDDSFDIRKSSITNTLDKIVFVSNDKGLVMFWKLVKDKDCFTEVVSFISSYNEMHPDAKIKGCFTSKCCEWKQDLISHFSEDFIVRGNLPLLIECLEGRLEEENSNLDLLGHSQKENRCIAFKENWKEFENTLAQQNFKEDTVTIIDIIKSHFDKDCFHEVVYDLHDAKYFHQIHSKLQKWTGNLHLGVPMINAMVSVGFHQMNIQNDVKLCEPETNSTNSPSEDSNIISLIDSILANFHDGICEDKAEVDKEIINYMMFLKCFKYVSYCAPDIVQSPHLLPHFVSSIQLVSIPYYSTNTDTTSSQYLDDVEKLRSLVNWSNQNSTNENTEFLTCFLKHVTTLNNADYTTHLSELETKFGIDFDNPIEQIVEKVGLLLHSTKADEPFSGIAFVESLSNLFCVVFFFVTSIKRFPLIPVYPKKWDSFSPFVLVLIEEGHEIVMLDPSSLVIAPQSNDKEEEEKVNSEKQFNCRCGRGMAEKKLTSKCVTIDGSKYPSRCLCFRAGEPCSNLCDCKACANPHGVRLTSKQQEGVVDQTRIIRKRNKHETQKSIKRIQNQFKQFRKTYGDKEKWTWAEYILFEYVLHELALDYNQEKNGPLAWADISILMDRFVEKYKSFCHMLKVFSPHLENLLKEKSKKSLEKRYLERQESIYTTA